MGYSCTAAANRTLDVISEACFRQTKTSNVYRHKGKDHFWEVGQENADGAITGTIYRYSGPRISPDVSITKAGSFRINPNGTLARGVGLKDLITEAHQKPAAPTKTATLLPYTYTKYGKARGTVYVDKENPSPDPFKKMIWGLTPDLEVVSDFKGCFKRVGKAIQVEYVVPKGSAAAEKSARSKAIQAAVKAL
jgi:hypothetical protein